MVRQAKYEPQIANAPALVLTVAADVPRSFIRAIDGVQLHWVEYGAPGDFVGAASCHARPRRRARRAAVHGDWYRAGAEAIAGKAPSRSQRHSFFRHPHEVKDLPPIAVVWGTCDAIVPVAHGRAFAQKIEAPSTVGSPCRIAVDLVVLTVDDMHHAEGLAALPQSLGELHGFHVGEVAAFDRV
jgi:hypothetical protein